MKKFKLFDSLLAVLVVVTILVIAFAGSVIAADNNTSDPSTADLLSTVAVPSFSDASYNDVSIPLADFPAHTGTDGSMILPAASHFKVGNECRYYGGSRQCDGFARYAFDCFWHLEDLNRQYASWSSAGGVNNADYQTLDKTTVSRKDNEWVEFFNGLSIGSVVRYGRLTDSSISNGVHTILFMGVDADGYILAYECNQDAYQDEATSTDHCGVDYQKYSIYEINRMYDFVLYYVEHALEGAVYENATHHTVGCTNCAGYLRQTHSASAQKTGYDLQQHKISYSCCSGHIMENHSDNSPTIQQGTPALHNYVYDCCGAVSEAHSYENKGTYIKCKVCGYINNISINREDEELVEG